MACEEKIRLIQEYMDATAELSKALRELHLRGTSDTAEYRRLQRVVNERGIKLEQARMAFEKHTSEHDC